MFFFIAESDRTRGFCQFLTEILKLPDPCHLPPSNRNNGKRMIKKIVMLRQLLENVMILI